MYPISIDFFFADVVVLFEDLAQRIVERYDSASPRECKADFEDSFSLRVEDKKRLGRLNRFISESNEWDGAECRKCSC